MAQDSFILAYCKIQKPVRTNRRKGGHPRSMNTFYFVRDRHDKLRRVCQNAFRGILNIGKQRLQQVCKRHLLTGAIPTENRGGDRKSSKFVMRKESVIKFIKKFKTIEVHYCRSKIVARQYLPGSLSVNKMCRMYKTAVTQPELQVKCSYFRSVFSTQFNIGFKSPSSDVCSTCLMYKERIKIEKDSKIKNMLMIESAVHKKRGKAFFELLRQEKPGMKTFSFDCQKNMVLPRVPDQAAYYSRQLYVYNFGVVEGSSKSSLKDQNVFLYVWCEMDRPKGSNEIASSVYHRLCSSNLGGINHIRLVADGCGGQNKNSTMMTMCMYWFKKKAPRNITTLELVFPVAGHSYIPPDRVFAMIEKDVKAKETIILPEEYFDIFETYGTVIKLGSTECPVFDWKSLCSQYVKPPSAWHFQFNKAKRFIMSKTKGNND